MKMTTTTNRYKFIDTPDAKGKEQHIHTLDGDPLYGTSTVLNVLSKPLTWWAAGLAVSHMGWVAQKYPGTQKRIPLADRIETMLTDGKYEAIKGMTAEQYLICLDEAYKAHSVKLDTSAEAGTDMHGILEHYVKTCIESNDGKPVLMQKAEHVAVLVFANWAVENVKRFLASEAYCYSETLWTGGIVDLVYMDKQNRIVLLDFKSAKEAYISHFMQNAGYDIAICENGILTKDGNLVAELPYPPSYYAVFPFGMKEPAPQFRENTEQLRGGFRACVYLHKLIKGTLYDK